MLSTRGVDDLAKLLEILRVLGSASSRRAGFP
jgi:hypothetical protein